MSTNAVADKKSVAARLVGMAQERYVLGVSEDGEPFGADRTRPHLSMLLRAGKAGLRAELASRHFAETGTVAGSQALTDATLILEGLAASQTPEKSCASPSSSGSNAPNHRRGRQLALGRLTPVEFEAIMTPPASQAA